MLVDGTPKIVDFGIARYFGGGDAITTGRQMGTPSYMAPEQLAGGLIAPCIDVWALGVMLFEMVTGRLPFDMSTGASPQLIEPAPRLGAPVSTAYATLVATCLEREPSRRPSALADVARVLRAPSDHAERLTEDLGAMPPLPGPPARRLRWLLPLAAIVLGAAAGLAWRVVARSGSSMTGPQTDPEKAGHIESAAVPVAPPSPPQPTTPPTTPATTPATTIVASPPVAPDAASAPMPPHRKRTQHRAPRLRVAERPSRRGDARLSDPRETETVGQRRAHCARSFASAQLTIIGGERDGRGSRSPRSAS